jgi:hypothetical protein
LGSAVGPLASPSRFSMSMPCDVNPFVAAVAVAVGADGGGAGKQKSLN